MASEYGWGLTEILEHVYLDDLIKLMPVIEKRKLDEYRIQLALITNPHTKNPSELWNMLKPPPDITDRPIELDKTSFDLLKTKLSKGSRIVVK